MVVVGVSFPAKKLAKQRIAALLDFLVERGMTVKHLELQNDLALQGPFDVILHKITGNIVAAHAGDATEQQLLTHLAEWSKANPRTVWIDPMERVAVLTDRAETARVLQSCVHTVPGLFRVPASAVIDAAQPNTMQRLSQMRYPLIVKATVACGAPNAHRMAVALSLTDVPTAWTGLLLAQELIAHGPLMVKCYVLDGLLRTDVRLSIDSGSGTSHEFDSQTISKSTTGSVDPAAAQALLDTVGIDRLQRIADVLASALQLSLFGFDVLLSTADQQLYVVDVNYFPAYDGVPDFFERIAQLIERRVQQTAQR